MNCDPIAPLYRWLEYAVFGRALERCRVSHLEGLESPRRALVAGDGDGRFLKALALRFPKTSIDYVDVSSGMLALARKRAGLRSGPDVPPINFYQCDVRSIDWGDHYYDLIACHFLFDVFEPAELSKVVDRLSQAAAPQAHWIVSEFDLPASGLQRVRAKLLVQIMYRFFRIATGLVNQELPHWRPLLRSKGFSCEISSKQRGGFIVSERWIGPQLADELSAD
jgi:ubiquinone/menaquinone biosynthesis C-methylase UbiE